MLLRRVSKLVLRAKSQNAGSRSLFFGMKDVRSFSNDNEEKKNSEQTVQVPKPFNDNHLLEKNKMNYLSEFLKHAGSALSTCFSSIVLDPQEELDGLKVGDTVKVVNLKTFGLRDDINEIKLFMTAERVKFVDFLLSDQKTPPRARTLVCQGPPGTGMSSMVLGVEYKRAIEKQQNILYVYGVDEENDKENCTVVTTTFKNGQPTTTRETFSGDKVYHDLFYNLLAVVEDTSETAPAVVVVDGTNTSLISMFWMNTPNTTRLVLCSSFNALAGMSQGGLAWRNFTTFYGTSWAETDYRSAMAAGCFEQCDEDLFQEKLYYAGGCVQAFAMTPEGGKDMMLHKYQNFCQLNNSYDNLHMALLGWAPTVAINSLIARYYGYSSRTFISEYVAKLVACTCPMSFVQNARKINVYRSNLAWPGWVSEMEVLTMVRENNSLALWNDTGKREEWFKTDLLHVWDVCDAVGPMCSRVWLVPTKWSQAMFADALYMKSDTSVTVVQITEDNREVKLLSLIPFVQKFGICEVEIVVITSKDNMENYNLKDCKLEGVAELKSALEANRIKKNDSTPVGDIVVRKLCYQQPITVPSWRTFQNMSAAELKALVVEKGGKPLKSKEMNLKWLMEHHPKMGKGPLVKK